ncbi:hypothetical protein Pan54_15490 [Rubinisphaera italica]|uniref:Uncharacterized protein n=1 Tax=Rubinisphaera italica TaxID=2527969 RepID=A0A5C5XG53_9PLAN|nr:hypothetical protein Pan54_15490 [Rubinisphaera italica]
MLFPEHNEFVETLQLDCLNKPLATPFKFAEAFGIYLVFCEIVRF